MPEMRLIVAGAGGRMGRALVTAIAETQGVLLSGAIEQVNSEWIGQDSGLLAGLGRNEVPVSDDLELLLANANGILDFTSPAATLGFARSAAAAGIVHVIGTTGLSAGDDAAIAACARQTAIVKSGNMSLGVNLLSALVRRIARTLDADFDIEVLEMHHNRKVDAPSGTALLLGRAAAAGRQIDFETRKVAVRDGHTGARRKGDIGFATLRGGTVVGDHRVIFAGPGERLELAHQAEDRSIFARGALKAALWARGKRPGLYSMTDVLGLADL